MQVEPEISFVDTDPSPAVEARVRDRIARLERYFGQITSCHVYIASPHHHQRKGRLYEVRLEVRVPGTELAVSNRPGDIHAHEDVHVAVRDAFDAMERQLEGWKHRIRGEVKTHAELPRGRVSEIHPEQDFGRIETFEGGLLYFHRNAVVDGEFESLRQGDAVEYVARSGESEQGPQASTVRPLGTTGFETPPA